jgi:lipopolysaccharide export system protein LptA
VTRLDGWLFAVLLIACAPGTAGGQGLGVLDPDADSPIVIESDNGIEWREAAQVYIASGNVRAARGDAAVHADRLTAHYRKTPADKTEVYRLVADGKVRIVSTEATVYADNGVYDIDLGVVVLTGRELRMDTQDATIVARDSLEYYDRDNYAVARGDALVAQDDKRLKADVMVAFLRDNPEGRSSIYLVRAYGNVHLSTAAEIVRCERAEYNLDTGIATLLGSVRITRGDNQLNGHRAVLNTTSGVSRLLHGPDDDGDGRVRGFFVPGQGASIGGSDAGSK